MPVAAYILNGELVGSIIADAILSGIGSDIGITVGDIDVNTDNIEDLLRLSNNRDVLIEELADTPASGQTTYYVGYGTPGAATNATQWYIKQIIDDGSGSTKIRWADGHSEPNVDPKKQWTLRATYTYI